MDDLTSLETKIKIAKEDISKILSPESSIFSRAIDLILKDFPQNAVTISKAELYGSFNPYIYEELDENERIYTKAHREELTKKYELRLNEVFEEMVVQIKALVQTGNDVQKFMFEIQRWVIKKSMSLTFNEGLKSFYPHFTAYINKTLSLELHAQKSVLHKINSSQKKDPLLRRHKDESLIEVAPSFEDRILNIAKNFSLKKFYFDSRNEAFFIDHLTNTFELLALSLEIRPKMLGFKKKLTIEYLNRVESNAGHVAGGFSVSSFTISLSEYCGASTFYHEWAHAFDYFLGDKILKGESIALSKLRDEKILFVPFELRAILSQLDDFFIIVGDRIRGTNLFWQFGKIHQEYILDKSEIFARAFGKYVHQKQTQKGLLPRNEIESYPENSFTLTDEEILIFTPIFVQLMVMFREEFYKTVSFKTHNKIISL